MTPAFKQLKAAKVAFQTWPYQVEASDIGYGLAAAQALGVSPDRLFKTLIIAQDTKPQIMAVTVIPTSHNLSLKKAAQAMGWKKAVMADPIRAQRSSGYILGGISPFGQKTPLPTLLDSSASGYADIYVSAGKRGLQVSLAPEVFESLLQAQVVALTE